MGLRTCVSSRRPGTEENNESDTEHSGGQRLRIGRSRGARAGGDGHVTHALRMRHAPGAVAVNQRFSDTYSYGDKKIQFVFSCYLIKHGDEYLLWDTGHAMTAPNVAPKVSLVDLLAKIDVKPEQIKYVGISHYHADHTGQVASFPKATVLIGKGDWDAIS